MDEPAGELAGPTPGRGRAWWLASIATLAVGLLFLLWRLDPRQLSVPTCGLYMTTGLYCPGCGATRATHELLHGRLLAALHDNAFWVFALPLALYAMASEIRRHLHGRPLPGNPAANPRWLIAMAVLVVIFSVLRNVPCYPFTLLAPPG